MNIGLYGLYSKVVSFDIRSLSRYFDFQYLWYLVPRKVHKSPQSEYRISNDVNHIRIMFI
jgi:hypothetical protein